MSVDIDLKNLKKVVAHEVEQLRAAPSFLEDPMLRSAAIEGLTAVANRLQDALEGESDLAYVTAQRDLAWAAIHTIKSGPPHWLSNDQVAAWAQSEADKGLASVSAPSTDHERWLAETWKMIEECAAATKGDRRRTVVRLTPEGCAALLAQRRSNETGEHLANEWADMATNGIQWLRNIRDGISTPIEALQEMESNLTRIQALRLAQKASAAPEVTK
jgi:hypothetical protein